jgi:hypothetical protein
MKHGCMPLGNAYLGKHTGDYVMMFEVNNELKFKKTYKTIKLPNSFSVYRLGRDDMDTRKGNQHDVELDQLIDREPTNGETYHCEFMLPPSIDHKSTAEYK